MKVKNTFIHLLLPASVSSMHHRDQTQTTQQLGLLGLNVRPPTLTLC